MTEGFHEAKLPLLARVATLVVTKQFKVSSTVGPLVAAFLLFAATAIGAPCLQLSHHASVALPGWQRVAANPLVYHAVPGSEQLPLGPITVLTNESPIPLPGGKSYVSRVVYEFSQGQIEGIVQRQFLTRDGESKIIFAAADLGDIKLLPPDVSPQDLPPHTVRAAEGQLAVGIPRMIAADQYGIPALLPGKGTPLQTLITINQAKLAGIGYGQLTQAQARSVVNTKVSIELAVAIKRWQRAHPQAEVTEDVIATLLQQTSLYRYLESTLNALGSEITSINISGLKSVSFVNLRLSPKDVHNQEIQKLLAEGAFRDNDQFYSGFDVALQLAPR